MEGIFSKLIKIEDAFCTQVVTKVHSNVQKPNQQNFPWKAATYTQKFFTYNLKSA